MPSLAIATMVSCAPVPDPPKRHLTNEIQVVAPEELSSVSIPSQPEAPSLPASVPRISRKTINGIYFEGVSFDSRTHRLTVVDQPGGPGSTYSTSSSVAKSKNSLLAINAGFFTPEGNPLGLVVSGGKTSGGWNSASSLGNGIFRENNSGALSITRRNSRSAVASSRELIQSGPLLLENGKSISGLSSTKSAVRSIILSDGNSRWWIGKTSSCTLASLGKALATSSPTSWKIDVALNLDGGRSTDLYISSRIPGGPINRRSFLNRPVRNFLILKPR
ncbi:MAG: phosphodiester glycosidase family protein [Luteolibacter sp.]